MMLGIANMKKLTLLVPALAVCLCAADFWQSKPFTDWTDKEAQKIETNSPWAKQVSTAMGGGNGPDTGRGKRGGSGSTGDIDSSMGSGGRGGGGGGAGQPQEVGGGAIPGGGASLTLVVSWATALPVRQAVVKAKFGAEAVTSPDAKKMLEEEQKYYGILVTGLPGRSVRANDKMKEALLKNTTLNVKGKDPIVATDVQAGGNEQKAVVLFLFPKSAALTVDDKDVEFSTKLGQMVVKQKFHLKDMVFNGKLEL
jgi:hypothetical protein